MTNLALARAFFEIADLMDLDGDNQFKANAYRKAARTIEALPEDIKDVHDAGRLQDIPGIGPALAGKIREWILTGSIKQLASLRRRIPEELVEITSIAGVGPKLAHRLHDELGITNIDELEAACRKRQIRTLKGLGARTEWNVLRGIEAFRQREGQVLLGVAWPIAEEIKAHLEILPTVEAVHVMGALRRREELVAGIELIVASSDPAQALAQLADLPYAASEVDIQNSNGNLLRGALQLRAGPRLEVAVSEPSAFPLALWQGTGTETHIEALLTFAREHGFQIEDKGIWIDGKWVMPKSEHELYELIGLPFIPPEMRAGKGEIEVAVKDGLPILVELRDLRGDLHCHSRWSDGVLTLEEMARAAQAKGYEYLAVCDHSQSLKIARGLDPEQLKEQHRDILQIRERLGFNLLSGTEVDILADGSLDLPDSVLARRDVVVASIHSGFRQDEKQLTMRVMKAMENPHVDIIGHPTGRLLGRRAPYAIDMEKIMEKAAKTGCVLEINASPDRLDLNDVHAQMAQTLGVKIAINTDAHSRAELENMYLGLSVARRAWLATDDVINTWSWPAIQQYFS